VRPTAEAVRDRALELVMDDFQGGRFLDLFAGTGAVGLEALSRGARYVDFVENGASALHALKANVAALRARDRARVFKKDAIPWVERLEAGAYDVAYVDPPYGSKKLDRVVEQWLTVPFARVLVVEHEAGQDIPAKGRAYDFEGGTRLTIVRSP
jgi:16S rRNA (guanine966-N2)-methyltransferase